MPVAAHEEDGITPFCRRLAQEVADGKGAQIP
jgi:hypothetical protein